MKVSDLFDENAYFTSKSEIRDCIKNSEYYTDEDTRDASLLKFFSTSKQRTYLVITNTRVYCILDDNRKSSPKITWSEPLSDFLNAQNLDEIISIREQTPETGSVDFGTKHKNWCFTKSLFDETNLKKTFVVRERIHR